MGSGHLDERRLRDPNAEPEPDGDRNSHGYADGDRDGNGYSDGNDCAIAGS
jgi:hypothetical protein